MPRRHPAPSASAPDVRTPIPDGVWPIPDGVWPLTTGSVVVIDASTSPSLSLRLGQVEVD